MNDALRLCPCGLGEPYSRCCQPLHEGVAAPTAERLMRSRYTAFAAGLRAYLLESWHASTRPAELQLDEGLRWIRLVIDEVEAGGPFDSEGYVTFTAIARSTAGRIEQRERSRFVREAGRWSYIDGVVLG